MSEAEFQAIFHAHAQEIRNYLFYKCGDLEVAADLMQESFLRLWKNRNKVASEKARSYLYTVGNRLFLDQKRHEKVVQRYLQHQRIQVEIEDPQFLTEMSEYQARIEELLASMPEKWRTVFLMNRVEKITYREIAERIGISVKAVEKRMHKALKHLQEVYPR